MKFPIFITIGCIFLCSCAIPLKDIRSYEKNVKESYDPQKNKERKAFQYVTKTNVLVIPFSNDKYGATDFVIKKLLDYGNKVIDRTVLDKQLNEMYIEMSGLTEIEMIKVGKLLNVNYIIHGSSYQKYGDTFISVKWINVQTGEVVNVVTDLMMYQ